MTRRVMCGVLALACSALVASAAVARDLPPPGNSTISATRINLVGYDATAGPGDTADSLEIYSKLVVTARDLANHPIVGGIVAIDFSGCANPGDVRIASVQHFHGEVVICPAAVVQQPTLDDGTATFVIVGGRSGSVDHAPGCARAYLDGVLLGSLNVGIFDHTNSSGMTLADVSLVWADIVSGLHHDRSDFDGSGSLTLADVSRTWTALGRGTAFSASGESFCP